MMEASPKQNHYSPNGELVPDGIIADKIRMKRPYYSRDDRYVLRFTFVFLIPSFFRILSL
jgi:hypothetical protein